MCEISLCALKEYLQLTDQDITLSVTTSIDDVVVSLSIVSLEDGRDGYKLHDNNGGVYKLEKLQVQKLVEKDISILSSLQKLPLFSSLHVSLSSTQVSQNLDELSLEYDGYYLFELPPCKDGSNMKLMEQRLDGQVWTTYKTISVDTFKGIVRISRCC
ncbi:hypothetical protein GOP47_0003590 [Adiantum capillus-veneris]|uniref:Uncharacterized protein n=1 Tax=Adiantum capillus-veneris TaxID=13818 RepID=A0A9D4ZNP3_ADICA|nr:hypothetical protein GOP47_0003590 [Adiantum capillus-veneris]